MNEKMIVVRGDSGLEKKISQKTLIVLVDSIEDAVPAFGKWSSENRIFCVLARETKPLKEIELSDELKVLPLALYLKDGGSPKTVIGKAKDFKETNISLFLTGHNVENFILLQILSSLGVSCGVYIEDETKPVDWDKMNDLMYYAAYSQANHAPIEPFDYTVSHYNPEEYSCFTTPWFENPKRFFYIDGNENIALSQKSLDAGDFIASGVPSLNSMDENEKYREKLTGWTKQFMNHQRCASCPAFRVCGSSFFSICEKEPKYLQFFSDLMEAAEQELSKKEQDTAWRL